MVRPRKELGKGKKTKEWDRVRAKLKLRFAAVGITSCELGRSGCWGRSALGFAHLRKRRMLNQEDLDKVVLLCSPVCHEYVESLPHSEMEKLLQGIIDARTVQP